MEGLGGVPAAPGSRSPGMIPSGPESPEANDGGTKEGRVGEPLTGTPVVTPHLPPITFPGAPTTTPIGGYKVEPNAVVFEPGGKEEGVRDGPTAGLGEGPVVATFKTGKGATKRSETNFTSFAALSTVPLGTKAVSTVDVHAPTEAACAPTTGMVTYVDRGAEGLAPPLGSSSA